LCGILVETLSFLVLSLCCGCDVVACGSEPWN
jgi:hypothetical protein